MSKRIKLIPPDPQQCQCEKPNGNTFMSFGGIPGLVRCTNRPTWIVRECRAAEDGRRGSMSLCGECLKVLFRQKDRSNYKVTKLPV